MAYSFPKLEQVKDNVIRIHHPETVEPSTYLTASVAASGTALTVENNARFAQYDLLLFEGFGVERAEIGQISAAVTAGTALTVDATVFAHGINTKISNILFDQVEISGATTATGSKTSIATVNLNVDDGYTDYIVSGTTYAFYFARFYNSQAQTPYYSAYCDAIASTDHGVTTIGFIRRNAFKNIGHEFGGRFTEQWVYDQIYLCELDLVKTKPKWGLLRVDNYDIGTLTTGDDKMALPSDIEDSKTNKSIRGLRISNNENMWHIERPEFEDEMDGIGVTTVATEAAIGATTLVLTDSDDFDTSGTIRIQGTEYAYTGNNRTTNTLSGFTAFTAAILAASVVWQGNTNGEPRRYTVTDGYVYFVTPPASDFNGRSVFIDYNKTATRPNSDGDAVTFVSDPQVYISWLEVAII